MFGKVLVKLHCRYNREKLKIILFVTENHQSKFGNGIYMYFIRLYKMLKHI